jgi:hypothetical protein
LRRGFSLNYKMEEATDIFLGEIAPFSLAYDTPKFNFVAAVKDGKYHIVRSRVFLNEAPIVVPLPIFRSPSFVAGQFWLKDMGYDLPSLLDALAKGKVHTPEIDLHFDHPEGVNSTVVPFHQEGLEQQSRLSVLIVSGDEQLHYFVQPQADWELRASNPPFDSLTELMMAYRVGTPEMRGSSFEVPAGRLANVDYNSPVSGTVATPTIYMHPKLDPAKLTLGMPENWLRHI